jgi:hypothetical protein
LVALFPFLLELTTEETTRRAPQDLTIMVDVNDDNVIFHKQIVRGTTWRLGFAVCKITLPVRCEFFFVLTCSKNAFS